MKYTKQALELKIQLDKLRPLKPEDEARVMQKFRLDWNYHSNSLEGNSLTYGETVNLLLNGITAESKSFKDHCEIRVHNEAIKYTEEAVKDKTPLSEHFIRGLHQLILQEPYKTDAITVDCRKTKKKVELGKYKTQPNHVQTPTGEMFYFAKPEETAAKMHDLINWFREEEKKHDINPIILSSIFHHKFILIHPFDDGNGRLVRILMNFILMKFGYPPAIIKTQDRSNYISALTKANAGEIEFFVEYIARNLVRSLEIMIKGARGEDIEEDGDFDKKLILLEQKMRSIKTERTKESVLEIFDDSIIRLDSVVIKENKKFSKFYNESNYKPYFEGKYGSDTAYDELKNIRQKLDERYGEIRFISSFLKPVSDKIVPYICYLYIKFEVDQYLVGRYENEYYGIIIKKPYYEQLTDEEIESVARAMSKAHLDFIETQLSN